MTYLVLENDSIDLKNKRCNLSVEMRKRIEIFKINAAMKGKKLVYSADRH